MKKIKLLILSIFLLALQNSASAQDIVINEVLQFMSLGEKTGLEVAIVDASPEMVEKDWKKFMRQYKTKAKQPRKSNEIFADDAKIEKMSANTVDVYAIANPTSFGSTLTVFFNLGGSFVSSQEHEVAFGAAKMLLHDFAIEEAAKVVDAELDLQNKTLKDLNKELDKMLSSKSKSIKEVEKAKALIAQREKDIEAIESAISTKQQQIEIQKEILKTLEIKFKTLK